MKFDPQQHARQMAQQRMMDRITTVAQYLMIGGTVIGLLGLLYLLYATFVAPLDQEGLSAADRSRITNNLSMAGRMTILGFAAMILGMCWIYITEVWLGYLLILLAGAFYWALPYLAIQVKGAEPSEGSLAQHALLQFRYLAWVLMPPGVLLAVYSAITQGFNRLRYGSSLDQTLQFGATTTKQGTNMQRFLGKCWQLPYCRDYIRQRCPIYHARRTCWRERIGCMCEEKTIMLAMQNVTPSPNPENNVRLIPYNRELSPYELKDRCYHCVIYNEHQRQKYQLIAPITVGSVVLIAYFFQTTFRGWMFSLLGWLDKTMSQFSFTPAQAGERVAEATFKANETAALVLYIALIIITLSYLLRLVETALFKWKI